MIPVVKLPDGTYACGPEEDREPEVGELFLSDRVGTATQVFVWSACMLDPNVYAKPVGELVFLSACNRVTLTSEGVAAFEAWEAKKVPEIDLKLTSVEIKPHDLPPKYYEELANEIEKELANEIEKASREIHENAEPNDPEWFVKDGKKFVRCGDVWCRVVVCQHCQKEMEVLPMMLSALPNIGAVRLTCPHCMGVTEVPVERQTSQIVDDFVRYALPAARMDPPPGYVDDTDYPRWFAKIRSRWGKSEMGTDVIRKYGFKQINSKWYGTVSVGITSDEVEAATKTLAPGHCPRCGRELETIPLLTGFSDVCPECDR